MDRRGLSTGSRDSRRFRGRERTPPRRYERYEHQRRGRGRSLSWESHEYRRRRRRRSFSSDCARPRSRDIDQKGYRRRACYESDERHGRRRSRSRSQRCKKRRRSNGRHGQRSSSPQHPQLVARRAGVVSDDEAYPGVASMPFAAKKQSSGTSSRDDTVGHFRGGDGTVICDRYKVIRDVGLGTFGRVVECLDLKRSRKSSGQGRGDNEYVAIKIVRDVRRYYDSAVIEAGIVEQVNRRAGRGISHCAILHDAFTWNSHYCMVFESLGPSLYDFLKRHKYCGFPMICVRDFARQLLEALEFLHSFGLIHTDLKPENILLVNYREVPYKWHGRTYMIPESTKVKVIDFGGATYDDEKKSKVISTRQYRAPEVILGLGWSMPSDLWSVGCILAELYLGELLFATHDNQEHLALIEHVISPLPLTMLKRAKSSELVEKSFDDKGKHRLGRVLSPESALFVARMRPLELLIAPEDQRFLDLLRMILVVNPDGRATAQACVRHRL